MVLFVVVSVFSKGVSAHQANHSKGNDYSFTHSMHYCHRSYSMSSNFFRTFCNQLKVFQSLSKRFFKIAQEWKRCQKWRNISSETFWARPGVHLTLIPKCIRKMQIGKMHHLIYRPKQTSYIASYLTSNFDLRILKFSISHSQCRTSWGSAAGHIHRHHIHN